MSDAQSPPPGDPGGPVDPGTTPPAYGSTPSGYDTPAAPPPPPAGARPGELVDRFVARLLDLILVGVVNAVLVGVVIVGAVFGGGSGGLDVFTGGGGFLVGTVSALLSAALSLGYFTFMESQRGQTVGKMVMSLHTESETGGRPSVEQAAKRNIWVVFGLLTVIPFIGGLLSFVAQVAAVVTIAVGINSDTARRQPWTDKLGGTVVVKR